MCLYFNYTSLSEYTNTNCILTVQALRFNLQNFVIMLIAINCFLIIRVTNYLTLVYFNTNTICILIVQATMHLGLIEMTLYLLSN